MQYPEQENSFVVNLCGQSPVCGVSDMYTADDDMFNVVMQKFFFDNIENFLNLSQQEIEKNGRPIEVASNAPNIPEEYFKDHECLKPDGKPRLIIRD